MNIRSKGSDVEYPLFYATTLKLLQKNNKDIILLRRSGYSLPNINAKYDITQ